MQNWTRHWPAGLSHGSNEMLNAAWVARSEQHRAGGFVGMVLARAGGWGALRPYPSACIRSTRESSAILRCKTGALDAVRRLDQRAREAPRHACWRLHDHEFRGGNVGEILVGKDGANLSRIGCSTCSSPNSQLASGRSAS